MFRALLLMLTYTYRADCSQARRQGEAMGAIAPPIPKVALAIFRLIKLLMHKPKKCVSANQ